MTPGEASAEVRVARHWVPQQRIAELAGISRPTVDRMLDD